MLNSDNAIAVLLALFLLGTSWQLYKYLRPRDRHSLRSVAILVLGDVGRSPRMMYHAESFAENNFETRLIGYRGSKPIPSLVRPLVTIVYLPEMPTSMDFLPFILRGPLKIIHQTLAISMELLINAPVLPEFILVQNPPSIPTLVIVWAIGRVAGCKIIIDWHNLGFSILRLKLSPDHFFVRVYKWVESTFGRSAYAHLFVTQALHDYLSKEWNLQGQKVVLHDRPPKHFHRSNAQEAHELFMSLKAPLASLGDFLPQFDSPYSTPFTDTASQSSTSPGPTTDHPISFSATYEHVQPPGFRPDRPALLVSSTSWTPDEEFGILLEALCKYDAKATETNSKDRGHKLPRLLVIITGKGAEKDEYMAKVDKLHKEWMWVRCISVWLPAANYPLLLGSADLGVSLHSSSSKMDLPMKVVDMFGCGLPVCALDFDCLNELVIDDFNGLVFKGATQLSEQLVTLFDSFPNSSKLSSLSATVQSATNQHSPGTEVSDRWHWGSWDENWAQTMRPLILSDVHRQE
ncbi:mannosyltransferase [Mycena floridula]|nr:mannosyltransferase [Mycena floridula]